MFIRYPCGHVSLQSSSNLGRSLFSVSFLGGGGGAKATAGKAVTAATGGLFFSSSVLPWGGPWVMASIYFFSKSVMKAVPPRGGLLTFKSSLNWLYCDYINMAIWSFSFCLR